MRVSAAALTQPMHRGHPPVADAPDCSCPPPRRCPGADGLERPARPHTQRDHPIDHHVAETSQHGLADRGKAGRPRHPHTPIPEFSRRSPWP